MTRFTIMFLFIILYNLLNAQAALFSQFFKPGVQVEGFYSGDLANSGDKYMGGYKAGFITPIKTKIDVGLDLSKLNFKDWKQTVKFRAHQVFWTASSQSILLDLPKYNSERLTLYGANTGISGIHIGKGLRTTIYNLNLGFLESQPNVDSLLFNASALIGRVRFIGLKRYYYYGVFVGYTNQRLIPIPFIGMSNRLSQKWRLDFTLPIQVKLRYKINRNFETSIVSTLGGWSGGIDTRQAAYQYDLRVGSNTIYRLSPFFNLNFEFGWIPIRNFTFRDGMNATDTFKTNNSTYIAASVYYTFGKAVLKQMMGNLLSF